MIDAQVATHTLFQTAALGQPVMAVPAQCDRAGLNGVTVGLDSIHWCSSGLAALARGRTTPPRMPRSCFWAVPSPHGQARPLKVRHSSAWQWRWAFGSYVAGLHVTQVLAEKITRVDHGEGLSANLTTSSLVFVSVCIRSHGIAGLDHPC
jgi:PiT family inorganic phosphate transporter